MHSVAIIGAGELGGAVAHLVARRDIASTVRLIDDNESLAAGKALDILQAAAVEGFATRMAGASDAYAAADADVIVMADRAGAGEWQGDEALMLLKRLASIHSRPIVICAGAFHRELVERGVRELRLSRTQLFGSAPEALAAAIRALVAIETDRSPREVALTVLGVPPSRILVPWDQAAIGGILATNVLDEPARRRLASRVPALWPPGPQALAAACLVAIECAAGRLHRAISCFVGPDDSAGVRSRAAALPVAFDSSGFANVKVPPLSAHDQVLLENAMML